MEQSSLFDPADLPATLPAGAPDGLRYEREFLSREEEHDLLALVGTLPFEAARYKAWTARRRVVSYGGSYDYDANRLRPAEPLIDVLHPLRDRVARWAGLESDELVHALVAEYAPGTSLGWHRDVPDFEQVMGVSLGGRAMLRFRPWPADSPRRSDIVRLDVEPRSVYLLEGPARWAWQHSVAPVDALRWSITFRTRRAGARRA